MRFVIILKANLGFGMLGFFTPKHILEVIVNYRIPVAKVYFKMQGSYKYLDKEGKLLPRINGTFANIPLLVSSLSEMDNFFKDNPLKIWLNYCNYVR